MKSGGTLFNFVVRPLLLASLPFVGWLQVSLFVSVSLSRGSAEQIGRADSECRIGRRYRRRPLRWTEEQSG